MPVRSLTSVVLRWPARDDVLDAARRWAADLRRRDANVRRILVVGSCARGNYGVGSDLDVIVIADAAPDSLVARRALYEPIGIPVPADVTVYSPAEWSALADHSPHVLRRLQREMIEIGDTLIDPPQVRESG